MRRIAFISLIIALFLALVILTACDEYAGEAFRVIKQRQCSPYEEIHCEGKTLITSTRLVSCKINIEKEDCQHFCSEVAEKCVTEDEWNSLVSESKTQQGEAAQDQGGDSQQQGDQQEQGAEESQECVPSEDSEIECSDGIDNDCDSKIDNEDTDCFVNCETEYGKGFTCSENAKAFECDAGKQLESHCGDSDPNCWVKDDSAPSLLQPAYVRNSQTKGCCVACVEQDINSGASETDAGTQNEGDATSGDTANGDTENNEQQLCQDDYSCYLGGEPIYCRSGQTIETGADCTKNGNSGTCKHCVAECTTEETQLCGSDVGECRKGTQTCKDDGSWGDCEDSIGPTAEVCDDNKDNDCDGQIDEDCTGCSQYGASYLCGDFDYVCTKGVFKPQKGSSCTKDDGNPGICGYCDF